MTGPQSILILATALGALGMWQLLPRAGARGKLLGAACLAVALGLWASRMPLLADWVQSGLFFILAGVTIVAAVATVTMRNPVYCAVWFGMTLLGTAGLFLLAGAEFLAVATIVVYAGAILVTFLFVLMLAQTEGRAWYDRSAWEALVSSVAGIVIVGLLSVTTSGVLLSKVDKAAERAAAERAAAIAAEGKGDLLAAERVLAELRKAAERATAIAAAAEGKGDRQAEDGILAEHHVARFGGELFGRHLIAIEVAGTLLLAALVGAAAIVSQTRDGRASGEDRP